MSQGPDITVAILNRGRPKLLPRVLGAMRHLRYPNFEVLVVGDRPHLADYGLPDALAHSIGYLHCPQANISRARNIAIAAARGEIIAFCDDDGVPEPDWLCQIVRAFDDPGVGAAGGFVRGPDGVNFQWAGSCISSTAEEWPLPDTGPAMRIYTPDRGLRASVLGVNSVFRRSALVEAGGFDEAYRYYLDESDAVMRLIGKGWSVAHVPTAEVHHLYAENAHRTHARKPRDFFEIAASFAHYCRVHGPKGALEAAVERFRIRKISDLDRFIRLGVMTGTQRRALERRFDAGIAEGLGREAVTPLRNRGEPAGPIRPFTARNGNGSPRIALVCGWAGSQRQEQFARSLAERGCETTLVRFGFGSLPLTVTYENGVWVHAGGTWRLEWDGTRPRPIHRAARTRAELARVTAMRRFEVLIRPAARSFAFGPLEPIPAGGGSRLEELVVEPLAAEHVALAGRIAAELRQSARGTAWAASDGMAGARRES